MKTNYQMCRDFNYKAERKEMCNEKEVNYIREYFNIEKRTNIELQNLRDFVVMYFMNLEKDKDIVKNKEDAIDIYDKLSAITGIIDDEKWNRGMEV